LLDFTEYVIFVSFPPSLVRILQTSNNVHHGWGHDANTRAKLPPTSNPVNEKGDDMRHRGSVTTLLATAGIALWSTAAKADQLINNTGLVSPAHTITFEEIILPTGTPVTNQYAGLGVTFTPSMFYDVQPVFFPTHSVANFDFITVNNPVTLTFNEVLSEAAFAMQTNSGTSTFTALLGGNVVETFTAPTTLSVLPDLSQSSNFYGFTNIQFDELRIQSNTTFFQIDNLQFSPAAVPEPGPVALLLGSGVIGVLAVRRKKA
jgi:hypothetical protein